MELTPEERRQIYEEEKARIEKEEKERIPLNSSTTELPQNVAGLLCYLAGWIKGITFLVITSRISPTDIENSIVHELKENGVSYNTISR